MMENLTDYLFSRESLLGILFYAVLILGIAIIVSNLVKRIIQRIIGRSKRLSSDQTGIDFLTQFLQVLIYFFAVASYFYFIPAFRAMGTAILATAGVASIVLGLAAQNTLGNIISGISILLYRPIHLGDKVKVYASAGDETGIVKSISLGYTTLLMPDGERIIVPNSVLASTVIVNYGRQE